MSATAARLTPADITALLGDGWQHIPFGEGEWSHHLWRNDHQAVELRRGRVRIWDGSDEEPLSMPATRLFVVPNLTLAGLIPGQVSVTQPRVWREGDPEPAGVTAVVDSRCDRWDREVIDGETWWLHGVRWQDDIVRMRATWTRLAEHFGPLTEVVDR